MICGWKIANYIGYIKFSWNIHKKIIVKFQSLLSYYSKIGPLETDSSIIIIKDFINSIYVITCETLFDIE